MTVKMMGSDWWVYAFSRNTWVDALSASPDEPAMALVEVTLERASHRPFATLFLLALCTYTEENTF